MSGNMSEAMTEAVASLMLRNPVGVCCFTPA
jgi:hypothetical protein